MAVILGTMTSLPYLTLPLTLLATDINKDIIVADPSTPYNISITGSSGSSPPVGPAGGDLSNTYPNPTVAKINGVALGATTATSGHLLIGSGSQWVTQSISGDVTLNSAGTITIANNAVNYAKFQQVSASSLVGNSTGSLANAQDISLGSTLNFVSSSLQTTAMTGDVITLANSFSTTLATVNADVGTFGDDMHVSQVTVNDKGLITAVSSVMIAGTVPGGAAGGSLSGTYPNPGIANNAITYAEIQQISSSRLIGNPTGSLANAQEITLGSTLTFSGTSLQTIAMTGDVTASANSFSTTVVNINGVALGTTTATAGNILIGSGTAWVTNAMAGDVTINLFGTTTVGANKITFAKIQQVGANNLIGNATGSLANATGVSLGSTLTFSGSALQTAAITGDITASVNSFATTLATVNSNVGTFGSATQVGQFTVNGKGLITAASNVTITGTVPGGSAGGDLTGTYPNPSVAKINGVALGTTTATAGNILIGSGTAWASNAMAGDITMNLLGTTTIGANKVTFAKLQQVGASNLVGNPTGSLANATGISLGATLTFSGSALQTTAMTGDVTASANSFSTAIASNAVTYPKFQQVAASSIVGNPTGSLANASGITLGTSLTFSGSTVNAIQGIRTVDSPVFTGLTLSGLGATGIVTTTAGSALQSINSVLTWPVTIGDGTNNFTTSTATATYYKLGHIYLCQLILKWTGHGSAVSGNPVLISMAATMGTNQTRVNPTIGYMSGISFTGSFLTCVGGPNTAQLNLFGISNSGVSSVVNCGSLGTTGEIEIQFVYWDN